MIDKFDKKNGYYFLSIGMPYPIKYNGLIYKCVETAYEAQKNLDAQWQLYMSRMRTCFEARLEGKRVEVRADWDEVKYDIMEDLLRIKYSSIMMKKHLLSTGDEELVFANKHGDIYWGVCKGIGENNLGKLLMKIRNELREAK